MKVLVTGATGFIGNRIAGVLVKEGHRVYALVRRTSKTGALKEQGIGLIPGDTTDSAGLDAIKDAFDSIVHCAAYVADKNPERLNAVNVAGTENICRLALRLGVSRLLYISSVAVVSGHDQLPLTEDLAYSATNLYGESKVAAERKVLEYRGKGLRTAILRPPMVYGEGEPHLLRLILQLMKSRLFFLPDQGQARWHMAYVGHVAEAAPLALREDRFLEGTFFVADREVLTCAEIFGLLAEGIRARPPILLSQKTTGFLTRIPFFGPTIRSLTKDRVYDLKRITQAGYVPSLTTQQALRKTARWYVAGRR